MKETILKRIQRLETRKQELSGPIDSLSRSLLEYGAELAAMSDDELLAEGAELGIDLEAMKKMQRDYAPPPLWWASK